MEQSPTREKPGTRVEGRGLGGGFSRVGQKSWKDKSLRLQKLEGMSNPGRCGRAVGGGEGVEVGMDNGAWSQEGVGEQVGVGRTRSSPETWKRQVAEPTSLETLHS